MDAQIFLNWLANEKKMSARSSKDVLSRYRRICRMLDIDSVDNDSMDKLQACEHFCESSIFIKSQLKRCIVLYLEFVESNECVI